MPAPSRVAGLKAGHPSLSIKYLSERERTLSTDLSPGVTAVVLAKTEALAEREAFTEGGFVPRVASVMRASPATARSRLRHPKSAIKPNLVQPVPQKGVRYAAHLSSAKG